MYLCVLLLKNAFDRAWLKNVLQIFQEKSIHGNYIKVIKEFEKSNKRRIKAQ